jgi:hypothetical protein
MGRNNTTGRLRMRLRNTSKKGNTLAKCHRSSSSQFFVSPNKELAYRLLFFLVFLGIRKSVWVEAKYSAICDTAWDGMKIRAQSCETFTRSHAVSRIAEYFRD